MTTATAETKAPIKTRATIFDIDADRAALLDLLEEVEETQTADDAKVIAAWFDEIDGAFEDKVASYIVVIRLQETLAKGLDEEAKRLAARAKVHKNRVERLKGVLMYVLDNNGIVRVETKRGTVTVQKNGGVPPVLLAPDIERPEDLPEPFKRVTVAPDMEAIRAALETGEPLTMTRADGSTFPIATLGETGRHVRIK